MIWFSSFVNAQRVTVARVSTRFKWHFERSPWGAGWYGTVASPSRHRNSMCSVVLFVHRFPADAFSRRVNFSSHRSSCCLVILTQRSREGGN